jgi:hypothetical protein
MLLANVLSRKGMRLLQLTGSIARRMPEIGAHNVGQGTEPILSYLSDLFDRRLGTTLQCLGTPADAALAFMNLVVTGPSILIALGYTLDDQTIDRYVASSVCLFLRGVQPPSVSDRSQTALENENLHLKKLLAETMIDLDIAQQDARRLRSR